MFKRKALALVEDLRKEFGEFEVEYNPSTPRRGSFEVVIIQEGKEGSDLFNIVFITVYFVGLGRYGQQPIRYVFDTDLADTIRIRYDTHVHN